MTVSINDEDFMFLCDTLRMTSEILTMEEEGQLLVKEHQCLQMLKEYRADLPETHPAYEANHPSSGTSQYPSP